MAAGWDTRMVEARASAALLRRVLSGFGLKRALHPMTEGGASED